MDGDEGALEPIPVEEPLNGSPRRPRTERRWPARLTAVALAVAVIEASVALWIATRPEDDTLDGGAVAPAAPRSAAVPDCARSVYPGWALDRAAESSGDGLVRTGDPTLEAAEAVVASLGPSLREEHHASAIYIERRQGLVWAPTPTGVEIRQEPIHTIVLVTSTPEGCAGGPMSINGVPLSFVVSD